MCDGEHGNNSQCQRMTSMQHSKQTHQFVESLIFHYAKFDQRHDAYFLKVRDLPEFEVHALSATIMESDHGYANEATGCDNPDYEKTMLPALLKYMKDPSDKDEEIEFKRAWLTGVSNYFTNEIQILLNDACEKHLHRKRNEDEIYAFRSSRDGDIYWGIHP